MQTHGVTHGVHTIYIFLLLFEQQPKHLEGYIKLLLHLIIIHILFDLQGIQQQHEIQYI